MADIEEIRKKVDRLIFEKGLNYRDVSLKIGRKDSYMQQYVKYGYPRRLKEMYRVRLAGILGIDDTEIMDDEVLASKLSGAIGTTRAHGDKTSSSQPSFGRDLLQIDVIASSVSPEKDTTKDAFLSNIIGQHFITKSILNDITSTQPENLKIVKLENHTTSSSGYTGNVVFFDASYTHPESNGLYLIPTGRDLTLWKIQRSPIDDTISIEAENQSNGHTRYTAQSFDEIKVLGKVVAVIAKTSF